MPVDIGCQIAHISVHGHPVTKPSKLSVKTLHHGRSHGTDIADAGEEIGDDQRKEIYTYEAPWTVFAKAWSHWYVFKNG